MLCNWITRGNVCFRSISYTRTVMNPPFALKVTAIQSSSIQISKTSYKKYISAYGLATKIQNMQKLSVHISTLLLLQMGTIASHTSQILGFGCKWSIVNDVCIAYADELIVPSTPMESYRHFVTESMYNKCSPSVQVQL